MAVATLERNFPHHFEMKGGWFRFVGRLGKAQLSLTLPSGSQVKLPMGGMIWKVEATIGVANARRRIRRLVNLLLKTPHYGVGTVVLWITDPSRGWIKKFVKTIRNSREGLRELLSSLREFLASTQTVSSVWDELEVWGKMQAPASSDSPAYTQDEFNRLANKWLASLRRRDRKLRTLLYWGSRIRKDLELAEEKLHELRTRVASGRAGWSTYKKVDELEEYIRLLWQELEKARAVYRRLLAATPGPVRKGRVDWGTYKELRREWFKLLCSPPSRDGLKLPPARLRGEREVPQSALKAAEGLWGEQHQLEGLRIHYLSDLVSDGGEDSHPSAPAPGYVAW